MWYANDFIWQLAIVGGLLIYIFWRKFSLGRLVGDRSTIPPDSPASSAIISYFTAGHGLINVNRGKLGDMSYALYATTPEGPTAAKSLAYVEEDAAIYVLDLPFNTESHFIGLSKDHRLNRLQFENFLQANNMEKVVLEGDFPDHFDMYAAPGQQFQVRYVLDPEAMAYVVDYCRSHFWEINNAELYFVVTNADAEGLSIVEQSQKFVTQIQPALLPGQPGAPVVHHEVPYGTYEGPALRCPICQKPLVLHDAWQACPDNHGILISGRHLARLHAGELQIPSLTTGADTPHGQLTCPNCHNLMVNTSYEGGQVKIDSCEHCPFRWLDASEIPLLIPKS